MMLSPDQDSDQLFEFFENKPSFLTLSKTEKSIYYVDENHAVFKINLVIGEEIEFINDPFLIYHQGLQGQQIKAFNEYVIISDPFVNDNRGGVAVLRNDELLVLLSDDTVFKIGEFLWIGTDSELDVINDEHHHD